MQNDSKSLLLGQANIFLNCSIINVLQSIPLFITIDTSFFGISDLPFRARRAPPNSVLKITAYVTIHQQMFTECCHVYCRRRE